MKDENNEDFICAQDTRKGVNGARAYKGRIIKHRNARGLQVLERATLLYRQDFEPYFADKDAAGKAALSRALNEIRPERAERRRKLLLITKESRRINRAA